MAGVQIIRTAAPFNCSPTLAGDAERNLELDSQGEQQVTPRECLLAPVPERGAAMELRWQLAVGLSARGFRSLSPPCAVAKSASFGTPPSGADFRPWRPI